MIYNFFLGFPDLNFAVEFSSCVMSILRILRFFPLYYVNLHYLITLLSHQIKKQSSFLNNYLTSKSVSLSISKFPWIQKLALISAVHQKMSGKKVDWYMFGVTNMHSWSPSGL